MKNYQSKIPACIYGGEGSLIKVKEIIIKEKAKKILVFSDEGIKETGLLDGLKNHLKEVGVCFKVFDNLVAEPSCDDIKSLLDDVQREKGDLVIGFGGGSVMDAAKLCTILKGMPYSLNDLIETPEIGCKSLKSIMIPTTCGTGSEATCNAIISIPEKNIKVGIVNDSMIPDYVILDPIMVKNLPKHILAATGVDALAHAVECFTSKKANPFSDIYALASARLIFANIEKAYNNPDDMVAKNNMLIGAFYGGVAISASGTTAVHALSYPLGGKYHIPHGVSNAILFAHVMAFNKDVCEERLANMCNVINPSFFAETDASKAQYVIDQIKNIVKNTNIPSHLSDFGIDPKDIEFLVEAGSKVTRLLDNNMKTLSLADIRSIYNQVI